MKFHYTGFRINGDEVLYRPYVPVIFRHKKTEVQFRALLDTGADRTILPLESAVQFGFTFDLKRDGEEWEGAGGGFFRVYKSPEQIEYVIEQKGFRRLRWKGHVYFTLRQPTVLLGHKGCLENLNVTLRGKEKILEITN